MTGRERDATAVSDSNYLAGVNHLSLPLLFASTSFVCHRLVYPHACTHSSKDIKKKEKVQLSHMLPYGNNQTVSSMMYYAKSTHAKTFLKTYDFLCVFYQHADILGRNNCDF